MVHPYKLDSSGSPNVFLNSTAYKIYLDFINVINLSVRGVESVKPESYSESVKKFLAVLEKLESFIDQCPPDEKCKSRFGNVAYRDWFQMMSSNSSELIDSIHPTLKEDDKTLINSYFTDSFGNYHRIDYGTGHEAAFAFMLCSFYKLGVLTKSDAASIGLVIFKKYLDLVRKIQLTYKLEPAGSHGAWGLDDFQFLPFIFGSSQLLGFEDAFYPKDIINMTLCQKYKDTYLLFGCVNFINQIKTGPFYEHSSVLYSASQSANWTKMFRGLTRMYTNEVLSKMPIIQHFWFGDLMPLEQPH